MATEEDVRRRSHGAEPRAEDLPPARREAVATRGKADWIATPEGMSLLFGLGWLLLLGRAAIEWDWFLVAKPGWRYWGFLWAGIGAWSVLRGVGLRRHAGPFSLLAAFLVGGALLVAVPTDVPAPGVEPAVAKPVPAPVTLPVAEPPVAEPPVVDPTLDHYAAEIATLRLLATSLEVAPRDVPAIWKKMLLADQLALEKKFPEAIREVRAAQDLLPLARRYAQARRELEGLLAARPAPDLVSLRDRAGIAYSQGRLKDAVDMLDAALGMHRARWPD